MMLNTVHFGEIEVDEKKIIEFPDGVPAFEDVRQFIIVENDNEESPFKWLQAVDNPDLAFAVIDPFAIRKDYDFEVDDDILKMIEFEKAEDLNVFCIVVVPEDISKISVNLKAPVLINIKKNKGMQVILENDKYKVRHYIMEEIQNAQDGEVAEDASLNEEKRPEYNAK